MLNTYAYSVLWPIRTRNHLDYCSGSDSLRSASPRCCYTSARSRCCCCCCQTPSSPSSFVKPKASINTGFVLYGLRQSTLIQWPSFRRRRLLLNGCDSDLYSTRNRRFRLRASEEDGGNCRDDVEAMLSLLSEDLTDVEGDWDSVCRIVERKKVRCDDEFRGRNVRVGGRDASSGNGRFTSKTKREGFERSGEFSKQGYKRNGIIREDAKLDERYGRRHCEGSDSRRGYRLVSGEFIGKTYKRNDEREVRPSRTKSSSCSSYYSLASSEGFDSDIEEDEDEDVGFRRSSERKIVEHSTRGTKSRKEASQIDSRRKREENSSGVGTSYRKQASVEEEDSDQVVTLTRRRRKQVSQTGKRANSEEETEIHEIHVNDSESQNQNLLVEREDNRVSVEHIDISQQQNLKENLGSRYSREERVCDIRRRTSSHEEAINVNQSFSEAKDNKRSLMEDRIKKQAGVGTSTQRFSADSRILDTDIRNTYVSRSKIQIRNQEVDAGLVSRQQDYRIEQNPLQKMQSDRTSVSVSQTNDSVKYKETESESEKRLIGQGSTTIVQSDSSKAGTNGAWKDSRLDHANSTKEDQKALGLQMQSYQGKQSDVASSSQSSLTWVSGNRMQLVDLVSEEMQESETTLIPPSSQMVSRNSGQSYGTGKASIQEITESGYGTGGAGAFVNSQSTGELVAFVTHEDALGSARRLEQSSEKFIGEFVKKADYALSTPETEERRAESNQLKKQDSMRSSGGSGAKGPSDEMWVTDSAQGTPQPGAAGDNAAEGNAVVKRSGRSLWSVIADIARLRWGPRAGSPDSSAKPAGKSSSNESVSSATWFSGREHDGSSDDNTKGDRVLPQEAAASTHQVDVGHTSSRSQLESSNSMMLKQRSGRREGSVSSPSFTRLESGSGAASYPMSPTSGDVTVSIDEEEGRDFEFRPSEAALTEVPTRLPSRKMNRSPAIKELSESNPTVASTDQNISMGEGRRFQARVPEMDAVQKPLPSPGRNLRSPMVSGSSSVRAQVEQQQGQSAKSEKDTDSGLTQRKLQRNKQVVRDSFEEWEEAYKVEAERRTVDEMFMREALVEAKKAADSWEVPVGAVLVHDGKIIARGFNLVEDLRDSTAHAEMICIREGSKVLRSWRLADTTLYVTLEPCPMCAGAILQARVNTLVWGAPNKLLGADGSWIRLFPGGEGNGSEVSEKPPPPVHPFHPKMTIRRGVLESECAQTMQQFFQLRRKKKDKNSDPPPPAATTDHHHHHHLPSKVLNKMHQILPFFCL